MAEAIVAGALLSGSVEVLLEKIVSHEFVGFFRIKKLDVSLLEKLETTLLTLQKVLNDAEEKQIDDQRVKEWLDKLRDAIFDADNLLDEINTEALRCKVEAMYQSQTVSAKVRNVLSSPFKRPYGAINSKIQTLFERLEHFAQKGHLLGLKEGVSSSVWHGNPTTSVVDESAIYGRDDDKKKLKNYLLSEGAIASGSKIGVITIVGMGGIGKTTLVKLLYNDVEVKGKFDLKAWACISKDFDVCRVTKTLLESVTSEAIDTDNLNTLQVKLQQILSHKRFLLVLDDIWEASYVDWTNLKDIFNAGEMGSKIIITTRDENVAKAMQTFPIYHLSPLGSDDCWSLIAKHAFGVNNCSERSNLERIGTEIAKKCHGLPLAAVALGGLLRTTLSEKDWNKVLKSNIWDLPKVEVQPALLLSYHYLPAPLKRCFAYCSIFPKNSNLEKKILVQLWIAEGLVHQSKGENMMEEVGNEYFNELVSRSLIRRKSVDGEANFEMHDLINDLATMVSSPYCIKYEHQEPHKNLERVRHLSYNRGAYDYSNKFYSLNGLKGLHTFLPLPLGGWSLSYLSNKVLHDLLPTMKQLRVLSLSQYQNITELPNSIENLIHLRYLNLSFTDIKKLPSATCKLYNLQTLLLSYCRFLTELPQDIGKLVNLRHLDISSSGLKDMPAQVSRLENLLTLSPFIVSKQQAGLKVVELRKFPHLQGKLSILKLQNVINPSDAFEANLKMKEQIDELALKWDSCTTTEGSQLESLVVEHLQPSTNLKELTIESYGGTNFPYWLGDSSFGSMVYLRISSCNHCSSLPPLGQLASLKELIISSMKSIKTVGAEFYGSSSSSQPFPSLQILRFKDMLEWEEWNLNGGTATEFPKLRELSLWYCPKLKGNIHSSLPSLTTLELKRCPLLESGHSNEADAITNNIIRPSDLFSQMMVPFNSLRHLTISSIPSLTSFPRDGLAKMLCSLTLRDCQNLEFLPHESLRSYTSLEELEISYSCCSLMSFPLGCFPVLKTILIFGCKTLKSICIAEEDPSQSLSFLQMIHIWGCHELESFPQGGLHTSNLINFQVYNCGKLNSLPEPISTFAGLQQLRINGLPNLRYFAEEGLPINLRILDVGNHGGIFLNIAMWGLQRLTCLSELKIQGDGLVNALMKMIQPQLPTSLVSLHISNLDDIKCLDGKWLQHLTSLKSLEISYSKSIESLPQEGLPSSLSVLKINFCPLLKASCQRMGGKEWPKIAHIPFLIVNWEVINMI